MKDNPIKCPNCGNDNTAKILWGMPSFSDELRNELSEGKVVLGGCCITGEDPDWHCNDCGCEFGVNPEAYVNWKIERDNKPKGVIYGGAVGDALGVPFEFKKRGSFTCTDMVGHGTYDIPKGTFSDDTSLTLATCDSIRSCSGIDVADMRKRFCDWLYRGEYTSDGKAFDVGNATATALDQGFGCKHERSNGNGSLMRIAPLALADATDDEIREVSAITHAHPLSTEARVSFVHILRDVLESKPLLEAINENVPENPAFAFMREISRWNRDDVRSSGFVLDTLGAALWCGLNSESYPDCVLTAVNLGDDTDTTACVAGALAGAMYGYDSICESWIEQLRGKDVIDACLF